MTLIPGDDDEQFELVVYEPLETKKSVLVIFGFAVDFKLNSYMQTHCLIVLNVPPLI